VSRTATVTQHLTASRKFIPRADCGHTESGGGCEPWRLAGRPASLQKSILWREILFNNEQRSERVTARERSKVPEKRAARHLRRVRKIVN
jgi:hypothetical protein